MTNSQKINLLELKESDQLIQNLIQMEILKIVILRYGLTMKRHVELSHVTFMILDAPHKR